MRYFFYVIFSLIFFSSCIDDGIKIDHTVENLQFSTDTLSFDTLLNSQSSATLSVKVYNMGHNAVQIDQIYLENSSADNFFNINVNGYPGNSIKDLFIEPRDSIFIFVQTNPGNIGQKQPQWYSTLLKTVSNNTQKDILIRAAAIKTTPLKDTVLHDYTFKKNGSYHLFGTVTFAENSSVTVEEGVTFYCHKNAFVKILGKIKMNGNPQNPIEFRGDRLDDYLKNISWDTQTGLWDGIIAHSSCTGITMNHVKIRNSRIGLVIDSHTSNNMIPASINNTEISNSEFLGLYALNANITANNLLITNCGTHCLKIEAGGKYSFNHATLANYTNNERKTTAFHVSNFYRENDKGYVYDLYEMKVTNSVIYGNIPYELSIIKADSDLQYNIGFYNSIIRAEDLNKSYSDHFFYQTTNNKDPKFKSLLTPFNFAPDKGSPMIDAGNPDYATKTDINGNRRINLPDIGAIEYTDMKK